MDIFVSLRGSPMGQAAGEGAWGVWERSAGWQREAPLGQQHSQRRHHSLPVLPVSPQLITNLLTTEQLQCCIPAFGEFRGISLPRCRASLL